MKIPLPNIGGAASGVRDLTEAVSGLVGMTSRAAALLPRVEALVSRIEHVADGAEKALARAEDAIDQIEATAVRAGESINHIDETAGRAGESIDHIDAAADRADAAMLRMNGIMDGAQSLLEQGQTMLSACAGPIADLAPVAQKLVPAISRVAETVSEKEVDAVVGLIDELPEILDKLKRDILPLLDQLGPDVHATMEIVDDVRHIINGLPGAKLFRRRGEEAEDDS